MDQQAASRRAVLKPRLGGGPVRIGLLIATVMTVVAVASPAVAAVPPEVAVQGSTLQMITDQYIVLMRESLGTDERKAAPDSLVGRYGGKARERWTRALNGFAASMSERQARRLAADPRVAGVWHDSYGHTQDAQYQPPNWGLNRIDQRPLSYDNHYLYKPTGAGVFAYVIDSGIRTTHQTFGGRALWQADWAQGNYVDCNGHGTHVAGIIGGNEFGVAKRVSLMAMKVGNCEGQVQQSTAITALDYVANYGARPAVVNMSLGWPASQPIDDAVRNTIWAGYTVVVASGNQTTDACTRSPGRVAEAITVGNVDNTDTRRATSNWGACVDLYAPGTDIVSASAGDDWSPRTLTGTSMSAPHVAGAAALWLAAHPTDSPAQVAAGLIGTATRDVVRDPQNSPNLLLYTGALQDAAIGSPIDFTKDRRTDMAVTGVSSALPAVISRGDGWFDETTFNHSEFASWAQSSTVQPVAGDYNGDGHTDVALLGRSGWNTIPVAMSAGSSAWFWVTNYPANFAIWATYSDVDPVAADFNGDGRTDIALVAARGNQTMLSVPVAFSNGDGTFTVTDIRDDGLVAWLKWRLQPVLTGDFNADGRADFVFAHPSLGVRLATSNGNGTFTHTGLNLGVLPLAYKMFTGDFNADGRADVGILPQHDRSFTSIQLALSSSGGTFSTTSYSTYFAGDWAQVPNVRMLTGDFNGDRRTDLALLPGTATGWWYTIAVAVSNGNGTFTIVNSPSPDFAQNWAQVPRVKAVTGDFNADGRTDLALLPGAFTGWWYTIPVAFANPDATFTVTNTGAGNFALWVQQPSARVIARLGV